MKDHINNYLVKHIAVIELVRCRLIAEVTLAVEMIAGALTRGNKLLIMGNGGSAADAQHFAAEMIGRFQRRRRAFPAIALTADTSTLTAIANDFGFEQVFKRQVEALGATGDIVIGISTSGNSPNLVNAMNAARINGCTSIALLGGDGGALAALADLAVTVPEHSVPHIQEVHITLIHILCDLVEQQLITHDDQPITGPAR